MIRPIAKHNLQVLIFAEGIKYWCKLKLTTPTYLLHLLTYYTYLLTTPTYLLQLLITPTILHLLTTPTYLLHLLT